MKYHWHWQGNTASARIVKSAYMTNTYHWSNRPDDCSIISEQLETALQSNKTRTSAVRIHWQDVHLMTTMVRYITSLHLWLRSTR